MLTRRAVTRRYRDGRILEEGGSKEVNSIEQSAAEDAERFEDPRR